MPVIKSKKALSDKYLQKLIEIFDETIKHNDTKIYLFGSRAGGDHDTFSDIDLAVKSSSVSEPELSILKERIHESTIPFKTDVVHYQNTSAAFQSEIRKKGVLIWKN
jgi:predicted nucleotidyltransferase